MALTKACPVVRFVMVGWEKAIDGALIDQQDWHELFDATNLGDGESASEPWLVCRFCAQTTNQSAWEEVLGGDPHA